MAPGTHRTARILSVVAAVVTSLACGTNYAYSAWAPEFGDQLKLSSTQENLIGTFGNLGTYSLGIPLGVMVDSRGSRPGTIIAAISLGLGYFSLYRAYLGGTEAPSMPWLCFFSYLTGVGSCSGFLGAVKTCAINWPNHRGTATAFALAGYGLSAFFFTLLSHIAFPDDTAGLLLLFTIATFSMVLGGGLFLRAIPPADGYSVVPNRNDSSDSQSSVLRRMSKSEEHRYFSHEPGTHSRKSSIEDASPKDVARAEADAAGLESEESSLLSSSSAANLGSIPQQAKTTGHGSEDDGSRKLDVRGLPLLAKAKFWQIFIAVGLLTGIGLMTINNIGKDARALWHHFDDTVPAKIIQDRQLMHVEILSLASFGGRLCSGIGSDFVVTRLHMSRYWMLLVSSSIFTLGQIVAASVEVPNLLFLVSSLTGFAYGVLYGVSPTLVVEAFGIRGLSQNWGIMTLAPIIFGNIFNLIYGTVFDHHSVVGKNGAMECDDGVGCYRYAYVVTMGASMAGVVLSLWSIRHDHVGRASKERRARESRREA